MHIKSPHLPTNYRGAISKWVSEHRFTHFITLTTHDQSLSEERMRDLVRQWDARINRALIGRNWQKQRDQRIWSFAFLEAPDRNPHWHMLLRLDDTPVAGRVPDTRKLEEHTRRIWSKLAPAGTVDIQEIRAGTALKVSEYVAKELHSMAQYQSFVLPDEFR